MNNIGTNGNLNVGFNALTKRVSGTEQAAVTTKAATGGVANDAFVRTGQTAQVGNAGSAATNAVDRLAAAYDADPKQFARNLAEQALGDMASLVG